MADEPKSQAEIEDDEQAAEVAKELAYAQDASPHLHQRGVAQSEKLSEDIRLDEGDLRESDAEDEDA